MAIQYPFVPIKQSSLHEYFAACRDNRRVIQEFCPLAESVEWKVGQQFYGAHGCSAFNGAADLQVPYLVNNNGTLSSKAASVLFASLKEAERTGTLEERIQVLEIGPGLGLFARLFLDRMRALCTEANKDYYDRLVYVGIDRWGRMLNDLCKNGIFANHSGHYVLRAANATEIANALGTDWSITRFGQRPFRAVFLNYILDCLPPAILRLSPRSIEHLCVRVYLRSTTDLKKYTRLTLAEIVAKAASSLGSDLTMLESIFPVWMTSYAFRAAELEYYKYRHIVCELYNYNADGIVLNIGAYECLDGVSRLLKDDGFILINDYGTNQSSTSAVRQSQHQRFSRSTAIGINFQMLAAVAKELGLTVCLSPSNEPKGEQPLYTRLLGANVPRKVSEAFAASFDCEKDRVLEEMRAERDRCAQNGFSEAAASLYEQLLFAEPWNWIEVAGAGRFMTLCCADASRGLALIQAALRLNPSCSADLWNELGESLVMLQRPNDAMDAYQHALRIQPTNARAIYNLACLSVAAGDFAPALRAIGEGLVADKSGAFTEALVKVQTDALRERARRISEDARLSADHVRWTVGSRERRAALGLAVGEES